MREARETACLIQALEVREVNGILRGNVVMIIAVEDPVGEVAREIVREHAVVPALLGLRVAAVADLLGFVRHERRATARCLRESKEEIAILQHVADELRLDAVVTMLAHQVHDLGGACAVLETFFGEIVPLLVIGDRLRREIADHGAATLHDAAREAGIREEPTGFLHEFPVRVRVDLAVRVERGEIDPSARGAVIRAVEGTESLRLSRIRGTLGGLLRGGFPGHAKSPGVAARSRSRIPRTGAACRPSCRGTR